MYLSTWAVPLVQLGLEVVPARHDGLDHPSCRAFLEASLPRKGG